MPMFGASGSPTSLSSGDRVQVLAAENLAAGALTMSVSLEPQPTSVVLSVYNKSNQSCTLCASPDFVADNYLPVTDTAGVAVTVANNTVVAVEVVSGYNYSAKAGGEIVAGTIWLSR